METTKSHCNNCGGSRNHDVLHSAQTTWQDDEHSDSGGNTYETLRCCGCANVSLRHTSRLSARGESSVFHFPPAIFRKPPEWISGPWAGLPKKDEFVESLLNEIYIALQNNSPSLATMGIRALLEKIMISRVGDNGSFAKNLEAFEREGHVSRIQRERMATILEAGHAAIHRDYSPKSEDAITLLDIAEHIVVSVFIHGPKVDELKKNVPARHGSRD